MIFYDVDVGQTLRFPLRLNGAVTNLTGATVHLLVSFGGGAATPFACTVASPPTDGIAEHVVTAADFAGRPGKYTSLVRVTYSAALVLHSKPFGLNVKRIFD